MAAIHEELVPKVAQLLCAFNALIDVNGNGTDWQNATTVATWQSVNNTNKNNVAVTHESDKAEYDINNRMVQVANDMAIFTNTEITAANSSALIRAGFTDNDGSLSATLRGNRGF